MIAGHGGGGWSANKASRFSDPQMRARPPDAWACLRQRSGDLLHRPPQPIPNRREKLRQKLILAQSAEMPNVRPFRMEGLTIARISVLYS
jgi:hypothetical protein